jgi:flagellar biosynthesis protein FlhF
MRLRTVTGNTISDALDRVHRELGPNALVLETRQEGSTTEVIAAEVEREEPAEGLMRLRAELALLRRDLGLMHGLKPAPARPPLLGDSLALPEAQTALAVAQDGAPSRFSLVLRRLREQGIEPRLVERVLRMIHHAPAREGSPLSPLKSDLVLNAVAGLIPGAAPRAGQNARCFLFIGPPSAGKTTTIAKLAVQVARSDSPSFGLITLDTDRPDHEHLLARAAEDLSVPFRRGRGPTEMAAALDEIGGQHMILIDSGTLATRERRALSALYERMPALGQVTVHLVLPANLEPYSMRAIAESFLALTPAAIVFTKVDETRRFGELINLPAALELPVSAIGHGRSVESDLAPATRRLVAEIVLGRRVLASSRHGG